VSLKPDVLFLEPGRDTGGSHRGCQELLFRLGTKSKVLVGIATGGLGDLQDAAACL
jgi:hypothetical protein